MSPAVQRARKTMWTCRMRTSFHEILRMWKRGDGLSLLLPRPLLLRELGGGDDCLRYTRACLTNSSIAVFFGISDILGYRWRSGTCKRAGSNRACYEVGPRVIEWVTKSGTYGTRSSSNDIHVMRLCFDNELYFWIGYHASSQFLHNLTALSFPPLPTHFPSGLQSTAYTSS
jgi:hypothetical protein